MFLEELLARLSHRQQAHLGGAERIQLSQVSFMTDEHLTQQDLTLRDQLDEGIMQFPDFVRRYLGFEDGDGLVQVRHPPGFVPKIQ